MRLLSALAAVACAVAGCTSGGGSVFGQSRLPNPSLSSLAPTGSPTPSVSGSATPTPEVTSRPVTVPGFTTEGGVVVGSDAAAHTLVVYDDPQCPVCQEMEQLNGRLRATLVQQGTLRIEYRMVDILGEQSTRADNALACAVVDPAGRTAAWQKLFGSIYADQPPEGPDQATQNFTTVDLLGRGRVTGLFDQGFQDCVTNGTYVDSVVKRTTTAAGAQSFFLGTPTALLDGKVIPHQYLLDPKQGATLAKILSGEQPVPAR